MTGSGPGGRILEADLRDAFRTQPRVSAAAAQALAAGIVPAAEGSGIAGMIRAADLGEPRPRNCQWYGRGSPRGCGSR